MLIKKFEILNPSDWIAGNVLEITCLKTDGVAFKI